VQLAANKFDATKKKRIAHFNMISRGILMKMSPSGFRMTMHPRTTRQTKEGGGWKKQPLMRWLASGS
jgi:hypothetical protein